MSIPIRQPDSFSGQQLIGQGTGQAPQTNDADKAEAERLQRELNERTMVLTDRIRGANTNLQNSQREYENCGFWARVSGYTSAIEQQIQNETRYRDRLIAQQTQLTETQRRVQQLMEQGNYGLAKAVMEGNEEQYRQQMLQAGRQAIQGYQQVNNQIADADKFLARTETGMRVTRDGCVIAAATIATGGTATAMVAAGYGTVAVAVGAIAVGTAAGTTVGGVSNFTRAAVDKNYTIADALNQTGTDLRNSAVTSVGTVAGVGVAGRIVTAGGGQAATLTTRVIAGSAAGGTSAAVTTTINTTEQYVRANNEFNTMYANANLTPDERNQLYTQFMQQRGLTPAKIARNATVNIGIGLVSGGQGAGAQAARDATSSITRRVLITSAEATGSTAIGLTGAHLRGDLYNPDGSINVDSVISESVNSTLLSYTGGVSTQKHGVSLNDQFSMPTFAAIPGAVRRLAGTKSPPPKLTPPPPPINTTNNSTTNTDPTSDTSDTSNTQNTSNTNSQSTNTTTLKTAPSNSSNTTNSQPTQHQTVQIPEQIQHSQNYQTALKNGTVEVVVDENLPTGTQAQAEVIIGQDGKRRTIIRLDQNTADLLAQNNTNAVRILSEEIDHTNQRIIDPIVQNRNGPPRIMAEDEYIAKRTFQEITAESSSSSRFGGPRKGEVLSQLRNLIDAGDFEGAITFARQNGLTLNDIAAYKADFLENINPNRTQLVQRSNSSTDEASLLTTLNSEIERLRNSGSLSPDQDGALAILEFSIRNKTPLTEDPQLPPEVNNLIRNLSAASEAAALNTVDLHPDDRPLIYAHVVNYKDTPQVSVDGALSILRGNMRPSGTGEVWLWTVTGDVNNIPTPNKTPIDIQNTDSANLANFNGQFPNGKVAFLLVGGKDLRAHITETQRAISHGNTSVFDPYTSPYIAEVLYRGDPSNPHLSLLSNQIRTLNEYRAESGLPPIVLSVWHGLNSNGSPNVTPVIQ